MNHEQEKSKVEHTPSHMDAHRRNDYQTSYDQVADEYVRRIFDELQHKPLDRQLLDGRALFVTVIGADLLLRATLSAWRHQRAFMATPAAEEYDRLVGKLEDALVR